MKNYSHSKYHNSGQVKWGKPVIVPEYQEAKDNSGMVLLVGLLMLAGLAVAIWMAL